VPEITDFKPIGVFPALPTPLNSDGSINYTAMENFIEYLEDGGVHGIVPAGCTGHAASLGDRGGTEEHVRFVKKVSEMTDLPVIAGDGINTTEQTIDLAAKVEEEADIDAHLMISPYQNCPPQDMIVEHYKEISKHVEKPIVAYNVPGRTGRNIEAETTLRLAEEVPGVVGIKEASGSHSQIRKISRGLDSKGIDDFFLGSGTDAINDYIFEQGGTFAITVSGNVHPEKVVKVWEEAYENGNMQRAYEINQELMPLHEAMFQSGEKNPMSVQYALNLLGFDFGTPRAPLNRKPLKENREELKSVLKSYDLL